MLDLTDTGACWEREEKRSGEKSIAHTQRDVYSERGQMDKKKEKETREINKGGTVSEQCRMRMLIKRGMAMGNQRANIGILVLRLNAIGSTMEVKTHSSRHHP